MDKASVSIKTSESALEGPVWTSSAATFVGVYEQLKRKEYADLKSVFDDLSVQYRNGLYHLNNVAAFFRGADASWTDVFHRPAGSVQATELGRWIYRRLMTISQLIRSTKQDCDRLQGKPAVPFPLVRIGASRTIGLRILPPALRTWRELVGDEVGFELELGDVDDLLDRLRSGVLDFVVSYGDKPRRGSVNFGIREPSKDLGIAFKVFHYSIQMVLLCHPNRKLLDRRGKDRNFRYPANRTRKSLPTIALDEIDFTEFVRNKLIIGSSGWRQPVPLRDCIARLEPQGAVTRVPSFQEAVALARIDLGLAVVSDLYAADEGVNVFALVPKKTFRKWIGAYYHAGRGLSPIACKLATFLNKYIQMYEGEIRRDITVFSSQGFLRSWRKTADKDWGRYSQKEFPGLSALLGDVSNLDGETLIASCAFLGTLDDEFLRTLDGRTTQKISDNLLRIAYTPRASVQVQNAARAALERLGPAGIRPPFTESKLTRPDNSAAGQKKCKGDG